MYTFLIVTTPNLKHTYIHIYMPDAAASNDDHDATADRGHDPNRTGGTSLIKTFNIQSRKCHMTKDDYERFTRNEKWASCEFFRLTSTSQERACEFCQTKCKTAIEGIQTCAECKYFAHRSLVKHHMFVCKNRDKSNEVYCQLVNKITDENREAFCRYCYFKQIVTRLPSLSRLHKYLVEFVNKRVMFVNSVSQKSMLWKSRLNTSSSASVSPSKKSNRNRVKNNDEEKKENDDDNEENDNNNENNENSINSNIGSNKRNHSSDAKKKNAQVKEENVVVVANNNNNKKILRDHLKRHSTSSSSSAAAAAAATISSEIATTTTTAKTTTKTADKVVENQRSKSKTANNNSNSNSANTSLVQEKEKTKKEKEEQTMTTPPPPSTSTTATSPTAMATTQKQDKYQEANHHTRSPRIKHVSRQSPKTFNSITKADYMSKNIINHLKLINEDLLFESSPRLDLSKMNNFIYDLNLSALPESERCQIHKEFEERSLNLTAEPFSSPFDYLNGAFSNNNKHSNQLSPTNKLLRDTSKRKMNELVKNKNSTNNNNKNNLLNNSTTQESNNVDKNKINFLKKRLNASNKSSSASSSSSVDNQSTIFNWDDFFDKFHKISTNQSIRFSSLANNNNSSNDISSNSNQSAACSSSGGESQSMTTMMKLKMKQAGDLVTNLSEQVILPANEARFSHFTSSSKRLASNLNSYKDRNHVTDLATATSLASDSSMLSSHSAASQSSLNPFGYPFKSSSLSLSSHYYYDKMLNKIEYSTTNGNGSVVVWDIRNNYDREHVWKHSVPVISNGEIPIRSVCHICASYGVAATTTATATATVATTCGNDEEESTQLITEKKRDEEVDATADGFVYCSTCCEGFHLYCLGENELPKKDKNILDWICLKCKYCFVCKQQQPQQQHQHQNQQQNNSQLLNCYKCDNSFHGCCLKKNNYPKKASKQVNKWICHDCFCCDSCGSHEISFDKKAYLKMTNFDFSKCFKCIKKISLGFYCKSCNIAMKDGEEMLNSNSISSSSSKTSESNLMKLLNCTSCNCWYHTKCLGLADDDAHLIKRNGAITTTTTNTNTRKNNNNSELLDFICPECEEEREDETTSNFNTIQMKISQVKAKLINLFIDKLIDLLLEIDSSDRIKLNEEEKSEIEIKSEATTNDDEAMQCEENRLKEEEKQSTESSANQSSSYSPSLYSSYSQILTQHKIDANQPTKSKLFTILKNIFKHLKDFKTPESNNIKEKFECLANEIFDGYCNRVNLFGDEENEEEENTATNVESMYDGGGGGDVDASSNQVDESTNTNANGDLNMSDSGLNNKYSFRFMLAQKKKNCLQNELVKVPYDDHTYAISATSIQLALQSSNIFNQKNFLNNSNVIDDFKKQLNVNNINNNNATSGETTTTETMLRQDESTCLSAPNETHSSSNTFNNLVNNADTRQCLLCHLCGDHCFNGRLLPLELNWIHANCILWSNEIAIENNTRIKQIQSILNKSKTSICNLCKKDGATMLCSIQNCSTCYHFGCAFKAECLLTLNENLNSCKQIINDIKENNCINDTIISDLLCNQSSRKFFCADHKHLDEANRDDENVNLFNYGIEKYENSYYIDVSDEDAYRKKNSYPKFTVNEYYSNLFLLIGSLQIKSFGDLDTISDHDDYLCPVNYEATRVYWSTFQLGKKAVYTIRIRKYNGQANEQNNNSDTLSQVMNNQTNATNFISTQVNREELDENLTNKKVEQEEDSQPIEENNEKAPSHNEEQTPHHIFTVSETTTATIPVASNEPVVFECLPSLLQTDGNFDEKDNPAPTISSDSSTMMNSASSGGCVKKPIITLNKNMASSFINLGNVHHGFKNFKMPSLEKPMNQISFISNVSAPSSGLKSSVDLFKPTQYNFKILDKPAPLANTTTPTLSSDLHHNMANYRAVDKHSASAHVFKTIPKPFSSTTTSTSTARPTSNIIQDSMIQSNREQLVFSSNDLKRKSSDSSESTINKKVKQEKSPKKTPNPHKQATVAALLSASSTTKPQLDANASTLSGNNEPIVTTFNHGLVDANSFSPMFNFRSSYLYSDSSNNSLSNSFTSNAMPAQLSSVTDYDYDEKKKNVVGKNKKEKKIKEKKVKVPAVKKIKPIKMIKEPKTKAANAAQVKKVKTLEKCINDGKERLIVEISSDDGFYIQADDLNKAWKAVVDKVKKLRAASRLRELCYKNLTGYQAFGLNNFYFTSFMEKLDCIQFCHRYRSANKLLTKQDGSWKIYKETSARDRTKYDRAKFKKPFDAFYWLSSEFRDLTNISRYNLLFDKGFLQARKALISSDMFNSMKYRHLKEFSKNSLVVKKSAIHGRGLFTLVDIYQSQMIIEYAGEIIRHQLCDKREKYYETKGIGCYMFKIDEFEVIDATTRGNQARFINHSCDPNCVSKVLIIQGQKHIIIFAHRFIAKDEELTYDYKFPKEDLKIECFCKSSKCRKYLN